ncbi:MAG: EscU/YscU/HrcU family type III secretion system export apparatus switch protein [Acidobacteria bacterium]|nr:EscU/YscU/HrcU family type III secretion system export apparatus switch protein [Acidobacteriota bacterium]
MADSSERTEKPTPKRIKDAREKGQVARSQSLVAAAGLVAASLALGRIGQAGIERIEGRLATALNSLGEIGRERLDVNTLGTLAVNDMVLLTLIAGPLLLVAAFVAVGASVGQTGFLLASEKLTIDFSHMNPTNGLQRLSPSRSLPELAKALIGGVVIGWLAYLAIKGILADSPRLAWMTPAAAAIEAWDQMSGLLWRAGLALVALGAADYGVQRYHLMQQLKMSRQELRDEARSSEGSPEVKARIRRIQREMNRRRMMSAVKTATVVITNPTHYAVALEYRREKMAAPVVVAMGKDAMAQKIKSVAREAGVPQIENVPLAQALYKTSKIGDVIPADLFGAVAEVLAYLVRIKQLTL